MSVKLVRTSLLTVLLISNIVFSQTEKDYTPLETEEDTTSFATEGDFNQFVTEGDSLYHLFDNQGAQVKYLEALALDPGNGEIYWRLSRAAVDIGEHMDKNEQEPYFEKAIVYADSAVLVDSSSAIAYLRRAIALGKLALHKGVFKSVSLVKKVRESLEKSLELDDSDPTAHYVMGRTHFKLCEKPKIARSILGLGWANLETARSEFEKAIEIDSTFIMYRIDYAKYLMEEKEYDQAKKELELIADLPIRDEDDENYKKEAVELLSDEHFQ